VAARSGLLVAPRTGHYVWCQPEVTVIVSHVGARNGWSRPTQWPGAFYLRALRALEQLALLLISTGELTPADLRLLPAKAPPS
jgi:hypothetical protein